MSFNIYEEPHFPMNVMYSKGARMDRGERMERQVDIYESVDTFREQRTSFSTPTEGQYQIRLYVCMYLNEALS